MKNLSKIITNPIKLLKKLNLENHKKFKNGEKARSLFPFRVPEKFTKKITSNNPNDPILKQIITMKEEFDTSSKFCLDPLLEKNYVVTPGLLRKYTNRVLIILKKNCIVNCRYCFRRNFSYKDFTKNKNNLSKIIFYIKQHPELNEVILSGGDPLMANDHEIYEIIRKIEKISHVKILRIHSRFPVVLPSRITSNLCEILCKCRLKIVFVTHINHKQEIDEELKIKMYELRKSEVVLLNQSVLLSGINDNPNILADLSHSLFEAGILPYYLHLLDKVKGTSHFLVKEERAKKIVRNLLELVPGYLVPRLVKEKPGYKSKILINLF